MIFKSMAKVITRPRFVQRDFAFNPATDMQEVDQFGFVNLGEAFEKGIIPSVVEETGETFNGVSNPGTLISHATDVFDGIRKAEYVRRTLEHIELTKTERAAAEAAAARASAAAGVPGAAEA